MDVVDGVDVVDVVDVVWYGICEEGYGRKGEGRGMWFKFKAYRAKKLL